MVSEIECVCSICLFRAHLTAFNTIRVLNVKLAVCVVFKYANDDNSNHDEEGKNSCYGESSCRVASEHMVWDGRAVQKLNFRASNHPSKMKTSYLHGTNLVQVRSDGFIKVTYH